MEVHWLYQKTQKRAETIKIFAQMITGIVITLLLVVKLVIFVLGLISIPINNSAILDYLRNNNILDIIGEGLAISAGIELIYMFFTDGPDEAVQPLIYGVASAVLITLSNEKTINLNIAGIALILSVMLFILFYIKREFFPPKESSNIIQTQKDKQPHVDEPTNLLQHKTKSSGSKG